MKVAYRQPVSVKANVGSTEVKRRWRGRSQNRLHTQKALMEFLLRGRLDEK